MHVSCSVLIVHICALAAACCMHFALFHFTFRCHTLSCCCCPSRRSVYPCIRPSRNVSAATGLYIAQANASSTHERLNFCGYSTNGSLGTYSNREWVSEKS
ncbi:hypothetical protein BDZ97DRAFT_119972 [Flammula alnicola]|nr:hypothetical protein BDZ97DRAFT_119972 [Flammula alnicola]